jgi:hypothetical protein
MKKSEVIRYYGTQVKVADALGMDQGSISAWGEYPPAAKQLLIERLTVGALKAEPGCLERVIGMDKVQKASASGPSAK